MDWVAIISVCPDFLICPVVDVQACLSVIRCRCSGAAAATPVGVEKLAPGMVDPLVGVRAKVVALGLQQVGRKPAAAVAVEESEC